MKETRGTASLGALFAMAFCLSALVTPSAEAQKGVQQIDHLTLLGEAAREAGAQLLSQFDFPAGAPIHVMPETAHPANWYMEGVLIQILRARGHEIVRSSMDPSAVTPPVQPAPTPAEPEETR